ncbi:MAG: glycosyltransferase family 2 protein, partial [Candidatus Blackburnbacteria bacterium]|nr:glycosyltransferase family 2 protein [Candidatus Blackburnbacteria bacterium]
MIQVSVVVLNWNGKEDTIECLESLKKLRIKNFKCQTVVVDNGSSDNSVREIRERYKDVVVLENKKNLGFAGGNNVGIKFALKKGADFVLILNNDTIVDRDLVGGLLKSAKRHRKGGIISPKIYFAPKFEFHKERYSERVRGRVLWYAGGTFDWENVLGSNRGVDEVDRGQYDKTQETDFATGACMLIKSEVLEKVGLFDERYFMYLEDVDLCQRAREAGWKIMYVPSSYLWLKVARSSGIGSQLNDYFIT